MGASRLLLALPFLWPAVHAAQIPASSPILGFTEKSSSAERSVETQFDSLIQPEDQRGWLQRLSLRPHHVGSPYGLSNAHFLRDLYQSFGWDAHIEAFQVLFPSPKTRVLALEGPHGYKARLSEPPIAGDPSTFLSKEALPPYNAYSCDGDVRAQVVYVNYGVPKDYEELDKRGIDVKGKIVIARYGGSWRGVKPKVAAEHGALGCILYTDPRDDGYYQGAAYPAGPYRSPWGVQRGSVSEMTLYPGDPLTPGVGATKDATRLNRSDVKTITKIPTLPISWKDAEGILRDLDGPTVPAEWRGALPFTYRFGPTKSVVHLKVEFNWDMVECRDVIATMKGSELPDEWVIRGNHYDGWVCGAEDPLSGQVALLSEAKALGAMAKSGWRPKRTIVYCSWDGEEPGLIGSTEWVETHAEELSKKAVAYVNSDSNGRGFFGAEGSPVLRHFITGVAGDVKDPETSVSVLTRRRARDLVDTNAVAKKLAQEKKDLEIGALGSGSDYSSFIQHLGIPSLDISYGGESEGTEYHSAYDTFAWFTRFVDPTFAYGATLSRTVGRTVLRLAQADALPFDHHSLVDSLQTYAKEVEALHTQERNQARDTIKLLDDGTYRLSFDPTKQFVAPKRPLPVPELDFSALRAAIARLSKTVNAQEPEGQPADVTAWNAKMIKAERTLLGPGLPGRPWYRHVVTAPGEYTGYGAKTLPGIREAIEAHKWDLAQQQIQIAAETIDKLSDELAG